MAGILLMIVSAAAVCSDSSNAEILSTAERSWLTENLPRIVLAIETGYAPFVFLDAQEQPSGLAHDHLLLLEAKLGVHFKQRRFASLDDIFAKVRGGEVHIVNAIAKTPLRSEFLYFTEPFITVPNVIVVRKERAGNVGEGDLRGLKVSLGKSYAVTEQLTQKGLGFEPDLVADDLTGLFNVSFGRSDAAVVDLATATWLISTKGITNLRVAGEAGLDIQLALGVPQTEQMLLSIIQKGLRSITEAERQEIRTRWINASRQSIFTARHFWLAVAVLFAIVCTMTIGILTWNRTLRREIAARTEALATEKELLRVSEATLQEQNEELQLNEVALSVQNEELLATEEMLRVQIDEYENSQKMLKESEEMSRNSSLLLQNILEHFPGIVFWKDTQLRYLGCNKAFSDAAGLMNPDEIAGKSDYDMPWTAAEISRYRDHDHQVIASGEAQLHIIETLHRADGRTVWFDACKVPIRDAQGTVIGLLGTSFDITERIHAEEERALLEQQFHQSQKLESLGILAGGIAHDFNNILTVIIGHCFMAREGLIPEQRYKAAFQKIESAGNRAADLCRQMLTYAGKSPLVQTHVNLWLLVDEVVKMLQSGLNKNVTIELDVKRVVPEIKGDAGQIQQIIMNLIINAAEAIGDQNGTIRVVLTRMLVEADQVETDVFGTVIQAGGYICLEVTDSGCGMNEETQKRIFEPFYTTKVTGRGLGMSAIHGIVKAHEGILQLTSAPGAGTSFKVWFPVPVSSSAAETAAPATDAKEDASGTILLVEDEELLRTMGEELLEAMGFTAITAENGREALRIYRDRSGEIDVILLDLIMPVVGGIEAYHELRTISPTVPIIICSGYGVDSVEDVIAQDQHAGFVHKPYKPGELRDVIVKMMKGDTEVKGGY